MKHRDTIYNENFAYKNEFEEKVKLVICRFLHIFYYQVTSVLKEYIIERGKDGLIPELQKSHFLETDHSRNYFEEFYFLIPTKEMFTKK